MSRFGRAGISRSEPQGPHDKQRVSRFEPQGPHDKQRVSRPEPRHKRMSRFGPMRVGPMRGLDAMKPRANARRADQPLTRPLPTLPTTPNNPNFQLTARMSVTTKPYFTVGARSRQGLLSRATRLCPAAPRRRREALALRGRRVAASASVASCWWPRRRSVLAVALPLPLCVGGVGANSATARALAKLTALGLALLPPVHRGRGRWTPRKANPWRRPTGAGSLPSRPARRPTRALSTFPRAIEERRRLRYSSRCG